jgi:hypothetical protein
MVLGTVLALTTASRRSTLKAPQPTGRSLTMARLTEIARSSRNGGCPNAAVADAPVRLAVGHLNDDPNVVITGYDLDDPDTLAQLQFDAGERAVVVPEDLILSAADAIRARRGG